MGIKQHEIRDPIHVFVRLDSQERKVLNSRPLQRLRHIHQLALTHLLYPGATHRRFEHSLGVMELASRVYDVVTAPANIVDDSVAKVVPRPEDHEYTYWRRVVRMAALCHDIGHLPFSHAAESELLPKGWSHELLTLELIFGDELQAVWMEIKVQAEDVAKIAVGPRKYKDYFTEWEAILSEIITGDAFGVDRMDYLLRDSHHIGVAYGKFDHYRLIDTLRIVPKAEDDSTEPVLGVQEGGLHSAEALLLARYFLFTQVCYHPVRRVYDIHLRDFLQDWLPGGCFPTSIEDHLVLTDNEVTAAIHQVARDKHSPGYDPARRIVRREHYKLLYGLSAEDLALNPDAGAAVFQAARERYGEAQVRRDALSKADAPPVFPVLLKDGRIMSSVTRSEVLRKVPVVAIDNVFIAPGLLDEARTWLNNHREEIIAVKE